MRVGEEQSAIEREGTFDVKSMLGTFRASLTWGKHEFPESLFPH